MVRDNGSGIEPELLDKVFELFVQGDRALDRGQGGLGIGLTLVKRLVELHQGRVVVESDGPGKGATFSVILPCISAVETPEDKQRAAHAVARPSHEVYGRRVLVVDDNVDAAESTAAFLRLEGHEVKAVHDGLQALASLKVFDPHVVVLDIGLPGLDGYAVARQLRERGDTNHVLLIALTGYGQKEDRARSQDAGFHHHFVKPADPRTIQAAIAAWRAPSDTIASMNPSRAEPA
jgi:CheY-like chemotaxis protein